MGEFDFFIFLKNTDHILLLQWVGVFFGALQVWYAKENKPINYLFGIVSILINIYVLYFSKLYAEIFLSLYYLTMSIRSEEHTSDLQTRFGLVCRLLL